MTVLVVIEAVALALLALLVAGLLRSHVELLRALRELDRQPPAVPAAPASAPAPEALRAGDVGGGIPGGSGGVVVVRVAGVPQPTVLAFLSSICLTCHGFWETFAGPGFAAPRGARLVIVTMGPEAESEAAVARLAPPGVTVLMSSDAWAAYRVPGAPYFVYVDGASGSVVGAGTADDWAQAVDVMLADAPLDRRG